VRLTFDDSAETLPGRSRFAAQA